MINFPTQSQTLSLEVNAVKQLIQQWQVGQVLSATVKTATDAKGHFELQIGKLLLQATSPQPLPAGKSLSVQVASLGQTTVMTILPEIASRQQIISNQLRQLIPQQSSLTNLTQALNKATQSNLLPASVQQLVTKLAISIPRAETIQQPQVLQKSLANSGVFLEAHLNRSLPQSRTQNIAIDFKAQLLQLRQSVSEHLVPYNKTLPIKLTAEQVAVSPTPSHNLTAQQQVLAQAITAAGKNEISLPQLVRAIQTTLSLGQTTQLIQYLANPVSQLNQMTLPTTLNQPVVQLLLNMLLQGRMSQQKVSNVSQLLQSFSLLQDLQQATDQALTRLQTIQLAPLARESGSPLMMLMDLPLHFRDNIEHVEMRLEQDNSNDDTGPSWKVSLTFNLDQLGPIQADVHLQGSQLSTRFWAERVDTAKQIEHYFPQLETAMAAAGLTLNGFFVSHDKAPEKNNLTNSLSPLIDTQA